MIQLIADIGATNSRWLVTDGDQTKRLDRTGYNAVTHDREIWLDILNSLEVDPAQPVTAALYGAGFLHKLAQIEDDFRKTFPNTVQIKVAEDLLGACHGMAQNNEGIVIIMGTGSNTCHYDGQKIIKNINSGGYILGDEGSAAVIGKDIIRAFARQKLPPELMQAFNDKYNMTRSEIILRVYALQGNQFMGQFSKFAYENLSHPFMTDLITKSLSELFDVLAEYQAPHLTHYFTGSIAVNFEGILGQLCHKAGITDYKIIPDYLDGIARYHQGR